MCTVVLIHFYVQTDINDQIIAVTVILWFLNRSEEHGEKKKKKKNYT